MGFVNFNGKIIDADSAIASSANRGLRYGDGLFETMRLRAGKLIFVTEHLDRLWHGMEVLGFDLPKHFTKENMEQQLYKTVHKNELTSDARIRLNIIRGDGGLYDAVNHKPNYIIECWHVAENFGEWNTNGLVTGFYENVRKSCDILSNIKHNNYLPYVMAAINAKQMKWNDAIVLNTRENVADTTIANIFLIKNECVFTPPLSEGGVAGIMRKMLLQHLLSNGWNTSETALTRQDVLNADEVFLTNSMYNIRWVQQVETKSYTNHFTYEIYKSFVSTIL